MDTGTGKSLVQAFYALQALKAGLTVVIVVPTVELIRNFEKTFLHKLNPQDANIFSKNYCPINSQLGKFVTGKKIYIGTYGTIRGKKNLIKPDLVIHDECHHTRAASWNQIIEYWWKSFHVGFTATPVRYDGKPLKKLFPKLITSESTEWFIKNGFLADFELYTDPNTVKFALTGKGDELDKQQQLFNDYDLIASEIKTWDRLARGKQTVVYTTGEKHASSVAEAYNKAFGFDTARIMTGSTMQKQQDRDQIIQDFEGKEFPVLINIGILTEGVDLAGIECIQLLRHTESLSLYRQMIGRVLRPGANKKALILDHAGNVALHGSPDEQIDWHEVYNREEIPMPFGFDKSSLQYTCSDCDFPLISLVELKRLQLQTVTCPSCQELNVLIDLSRKQLASLKSMLTFEEYELVLYNRDSRLSVATEIVKIKNSPKIPYTVKIEKLRRIKGITQDLLKESLIQIGMNPDLARQYKPVSA
jgi:superfamily II DNA or RNA helicase